MIGPLPWIRRATPWVLAGAMFFLTFMSISRVAALRTDLGGQMERQLEDDVVDRVDRWERSLLDQLTEWAELAASNPSRLDEIQERLRRARPWFDSIYIWTPSEEISVGGRTMSSDGTMRFPDPEPMRENPNAMRRIPCLARARAFAAQPAVDAELAAAGWLESCAGHDLSVTTLALTEAVNLLLQEDRIEAADQALQQYGFPLDVRLRDASRMGLPPGRAMVVQTQRAEVLERQGRMEESIDLLYRIGNEITDLDAPDAALLLKWVSYPILPQLRRYGQADRVEALERRELRSKRRVEGYRDVTENLLPRLVPAGEGVPRFVVDQYGAEPYLVFSHWAADGRIGVAIQLDQQRLLEAFLVDQRRFRGEISIRHGSDDRIIAGSQDDTAVAFEVPFSQTLTHLRVALVRTALEQRLSRLNRIWILPALLLFLVVVLGIFALVEQVRASRRQRLLLVRQKEFATRVTHELKTPLAGIRVMAENLEFGHFKDPSERQRMARAIVQEADTLTLRVNEILSVTKERMIRRPERFDPEEPLFDAVDAWGPRYEAAGIRFEADLASTEEVMGDAEALRDAVACLLDNALKYRDESKPESRVVLTSEDVGQEIVIAVEDNGLGVPADMRESIFSRFVRVEGDNRGKAGGHGLGLAQVASILEQHGGTSRCEAGADGGSRFVLTLPVAS